MLNIADIEEIRQFRSDLTNSLDYKTIVRINDSLSTGWVLIDLQCTERNYLATLGRLRKQTTPPKVIL